MKKRNYYFSAFILIIVFMFLIFEETKNTEIQKIKTKMDVTKQDVELYIYTVQNFLYALNEIGQTELQKQITYENTNNFELENVFFYNYTNSFETDLSKTVSTKVPNHIADTNLSNIQKELSIVNKQTTFLQSVFNKHILDGVYYISNNEFASYYPFNKYENFVANNFKAISVYENDFKKNIEKGQIYHATFHKNYLNNKKNTITLYKGFFDKDKHLGTLVLVYNTDTINNYLNANNYPSILLNKDNYILSYNDKYLNSIKSNATLEEKKDLIFKHNMIGGFSKTQVDLNNFDSTKYKFNVNVLENLKAKLKISTNNLSSFNFSLKLYNATYVSNKDYILISFIPLLLILKTTIFKIIPLGIFVLLLFKLIVENRKSYITKNSLEKAIEDLKNANIEMEKLASEDFLTKLNNRRYVYKQLLKQRRSLSKEPSSVILLLDIDHFKKINDTYGHSEGDTVLKELAVLVTNSLRKTDIISRWGGEEILCILTDTNLANAYYVAENLRKKVENYTFSKDRNNISLTISIGLADFPVKSHFKKQVAVADKALYEAKKTGRNKVLAKN